MAFFVKGALDPAAVEECLRTLIRRHPALRTGFRMTDNDVVQRVEDDVPFSIEVRETATPVERIAEEFMRPFDLSQAPLIRVCLAKAGRDGTFFLVDTHHIVFDGISGDILIGEMLKLLNGEKLLPLKAGYRDYAEREQAYLASENCKHHEAYWLAAFRPEMPALNLPTDRNRAASRTFRGRRIFHEIGAEKTKALKKMSQRNGSTLFMLLFAAYFTLLHKLTGQQDIAVGTTFDGRMDERFSGVIGMFVNTIAIRTRPGRQKSFKGFLEEVKRAVFEAFDRQEYPFEMMVAKLGVRREISRNPIFDTMFVYERIETKSAQSGGLTITKYDLDNRTAIFDLTHEVLEIEGALSVSMEFDSDLFEDATIRRFLEFYDRILERILEDPDRRLADIDLLGAEDRHTVLEGFNDTAAAPAGDRMAVHLFERQVAQTPDATAIVFGDRSLSYRELNERANRLAHHLITRHAVGPNTLVGVMTARSDWMIVGILGVLKAGGAYVPIDPDYPEERVRTMLADAGCRVVLTDGEGPGIPGGDESAPQALDVRDVQDGSIENPSPTAGPSDLCYVIYTSGSTGRPKGCQLEHGNLSHYLSWASEYYFEGRDYGSFGLYTSLSFDLTVTSIFCTLLRGRCLTIYDNDTDVLEILAHSLGPDSPVDCIKITPSHISLLKHLELKATGVRLAIVGGEQLTIEQVRLLRDLNPHMRIVNEYGPTEFTVGCIVREIGSGDQTVLIGKPISNTRVYILDEQLSPVPIGVAGEICLAGAGLSRGYLNRPDLTAEKFVPDPFREGERMYRTGDLGKWMPDGSITCLGRIDHQVKIRGYRIEPGEIESVLSSHPGIDQAAVLAREDEAGDRFLCAYLVTAGELQIEELRIYLGAKLPDYMIPARFFRIEKMPLTSNGKIDSKALLSVEGAGLAHSTGFAGPETENETLLVSIWKAVLGREEIGVLDNYFALGGDSIKAIQILSRLKQHHLKLEVRHIFETPTIRALAKKMVAENHIPQQGMITGRVPLTAIQTWFFKEHGEEHDHYVQAVLLRSKDAVEERALRLSLRKLQEHHDSLRMTFRFEGQTVVQEMAGPEYPLDFTVVDLKGKTDARRELDRICAQVPASFHIDKGPMMKTVLFRQDDADRILIVIHHLAVDGVSWRILLEDLGACYGQALGGQAPALPPKTDSYLLWSEKIARYSSSPQLLEEISFWQQIAQADALAIPPDFACATNRYEDLGTASVELDRNATQALMTQANRAYHTEVNDLLLAAFGRAMQKCYGAARGFIDIEGHGREALFKDLDVGRTVGWFTSMYPALIDIPRSNDLGLQIKQIKEGLRRLPNKGVGYGILKYLSPDEKRPQMQFGRGARILFNYLGSFDAGAEEIFCIDDANVGNTIGGASKRESEIVIEGAVIGRRLKLNLSYNTKIHAQETVDRFLRSYRDELLGLIDHCVSKELEELTPHDLTYKDLTVPELDSILCACGIAGANLKDIYPLSPLQEGMLFHALLESNPEDYFVQISFGIDGPLNPALFEACWNLLVERHDILRTVFTHKGADRPLQVVTRRARIDFGYEDISALPEARQRECLAEFRNTDRQKGFELTVKVPMRVSVFRTAERAFEVIWSYHHLLVDGWCAGILMSEFFEAYGILLQGGSPAIPPAAPYGDYIRWLEHRDRTSTIDYWRTYLAGYDHPAVLPKEFTEEGAKEFSPQTLVLEIGPQMVQGLKQFASDHQVTVNTVIQTAWGLVLGRYSGADDVVFGATVSGRPAQVAGIESMAGLFINTVPVRIRITPEKTLARLARDVQADALQSEAHHYASLADVQAATPLKQELLDNVMVFENYPLAEELIGLERKYPLDFSIKEVQVFEQTNYHLMIVVEPGEKMHVEFRYNAAVFAGSLMEQVKAAFAAIIGSVADGTASSIGELQLSAMSADEKNERAAFIKSAQNISEEF